ncbi:hypothetical protein ACE6H2_010336 [Prunus campanulata]
MAPPIPSLDVSYSSFQGARYTNIRLYSGWPENLRYHIYMCHAFSCTCTRKGSWVLDKCLQPHESHIPFILQFMVDYNLYGMGHPHVSKIKFRHPIPDAFCPRKSVHNGQPSQDIDKSTCMPADFQADIHGHLSLGSPVWTQFQLTGRGILLEYERTGIHEAAIPTDPAKPLPEDTLKTNRKDVRPVEQMTSPKDEGNFVGLQADNLIDGNIIGSPSTQDSTEERVSNAKLSLNKELPASQVIETINMKAADNEALGHP